MTPFPARVPRTSVDAPTSSQETVSFVRGSVYSRTILLKPSSEVRERVFLEASPAVMYTGSE